MVEIKISIPNELEEDIKNISRLKLSLAVARMIRSELERITRVKSIIAKSKLTEDDAKEFSDKVDKALSKIFLESVK